MASGQSIGAGNLKNCILQNIRYNLNLKMILFRSSILSPTALSSVNSSLNYGHLLRRDLNEDESFDNGI